MKAPATLIIILASLFTAFADFPSIEGLTSHLFTNAVIVWQAPTNGLPQSFWIYHRMLPRIFSETIISNAIVLGSLQGKGFPRPSTNDLFIPEDVPPNWPGPIFPIFYMRPSDATLSYEMQGYAKDSDKAAKGIPDDQTITARAWKYAGQLGLDRNQLAVKSFYTHFCDAGENQTVETNAICGRGVFLARQLDGISFFPTDDQGDGAEGFFVEFGSYGKIRSYSLCWSDVQRGENVPIFKSREIIHNIRIHKILILPDDNEINYFGRLEKLASARKFVVTKITPYYFKFNGVIGEAPTNDTPSKLITPMAELDAIADFGNSNAVIRMVTPIAR